MDKNDKYKQPGPIKIYPTYLDATLKYSQGRKIAKSISIDNPKLDEILKVCENFGLQCKVEIAVKKLVIFKKHHPKDWMKRGRVLVNLKEGGKALSVMNSKFELLKIIGFKIKETRDGVKASVQEDSIGVDSKKNPKRRKKK